MDIDFILAMSEFIVIFLASFSNMDFSIELFNMNSAVAFCIHDADIQKTLPCILCILLWPARAQAVDFEVNVKANVFIQAFREQTLTGLFPMRARH